MRIQKNFQNTRFFKGMVFIYRIFSSSVKKLGYF
jgi:hypothetical protein